MPEIETQEYFRVKTDMILDMMGAMRKCATLTPAALASAARIERELLNLSLLLLEVRDVKKA